MKLLIILVSLILLGLFAFWMWIDNQRREHKFAENLRRIQIDSYLDMRLITLTSKASPEVKQQALSSIDKRLEFYGFDVKSFTDL